MSRILALAVTLTAAFAALAVEPYKPEYETVSGVVKELIVLKTGITFRKTVNGAYGRQEVTDYRKLGDKCVVAVDGIRMKFTDLKPGYLVVIEYEKKTELATRVTATTPEAAESERLKKEATAAFERKVAEDYVRMLRKTAENVAAKEKAAREKARKDRITKMKEKQEKDKDKGEDVPKEEEKKSPRIPRISRIINCISFV